MFKPFFIHFNRPVKKTDNSKKRHAPRGFTAYIEPVSDKPEDVRDAHITVSFCSSKDDFKKADGRSMVMIARAAKDSVKFNRRNVPDILAACANACAIDDKKVSQDFYYVLKYVI